MVLIPSGSDPLGNYTITSDFYLMTTEVTQGMFTAMMPYNPSSNFGIGDEYPVYFVNWHMAADFANKVTQRHNTVNGSSLQECYICLATGTDNVTCNEATDHPNECTGYVLPTEAEWEYSARSGTTFDFWTSDGGGEPPLTDATSCGLGVDDTTVLIVDGATNPPFSNYAWWCGNLLDITYGEGPKPVGLKSPNEFGLHDMHGNAMEWTGDYNGCAFPLPGADPYCGTSSPSSASKMQQRGGSWARDAANARASYRTVNEPDYSFDDTGFRLGLHP
jgi:formylglycine-generating enzyme required for sulfatase activity